MTPRHIVRVNVSAELLKTVLGFPDGTDLFEIERHDTQPDVFVLYVEHPDLPEWVDLIMPPEITPIITVDYDKRPATWITFDWNLPKGD